MPYRVIDLSYSDRRGRIDDEPLQRLLAGHRVVRSRETFYLHEGRPHLLVALEYRLAAMEGGEEKVSRRGEGKAARGANGPGKGDDRQKWRDRLEEADLPRFEVLRAWRTARAHADGVPPYVVLTNLQLAELVRRSPSSRRALAEVPGIGPARIERFGDEILRVLESGVVPADLAPSRPPAGRIIESPAGRKARSLRPAERFPPLLASASR